MTDTLNHSSDQEAFERGILTLAPGANLSCIRGYGYTDQRVRDMYAGWQLALRQVIEEEAGK